jgi:uncharacterized cupin superfamily protein
MAWTSTAGYNVGSTNFAIIDHTASASQDVPVTKLVYGADSADPTRVTSTAGLPVVSQRLSGAPTTSRISNATASSGATGNGTALSTSGSADPGIFEVTADPDNATVVVIGDSSATAGSGSVRGKPLQAGDSFLVNTDDLRTWKLAVRTANDAVAIVKLGS